MFPTVAASLGYVNSC